MSLFYKEQSDEPKVFTMIVTSILFILILFIIWMAVGPRYRVWQLDLRGQANLRQQEWEKKIAIEEAKALQESASLKAKAEVERAKGVAEANSIISSSLKDNEEYLRYLWIDQLASGKAGQIIYVPTEAGLPILEASKR